MRLPSALALAALLACVGAPAVAKPSAKWTVLVYMNGRNNLALDSIRDMRELETVGSTDEVNIVVELGLIEPAGLPVKFESLSGVRRYRVVKNPLPDVLAGLVSPVVADLGETDMGDYKHLAEFLKWGAKEYPAERYAAVVWGHGGGWVVPAQQAPPPPRSWWIAARLKSLSPDCARGKCHSMSNQEFKMALDLFGRKLDVLANDSCLMQDASFLHEISGAADYVVGSEDSVPHTGYNYKALAGLIASPDASPAALAEAAVASYAANYAFADKRTTLSAIRTSEMKPFIAKLDAFSRAALARARSDPAEKALYRRISEASVIGADYGEKDLGAVLYWIHQESKYQDVKTAASELYDQLGALVLARGGTGSGSLARGVSVYLPGDEYDAGFGRSKLAADTSWDEFIQEVIKKESPLGKAAALIAEQTFVRPKNGFPASVKH